MIAGLEFVSFAPSLLLYGWAFERLWNWYAVPFGVRAVDFAWSIGLVILGSLVTAHYTPVDEDAERIERVVFNLIAPLLLLGTAFVVRAVAA